MTALGKSPHLKGWIFLTVLLLPTPASAGQPSLEAAIEATYLYKLGPFISWPTDRSGKPFAICIVGEDPFGAVLDQAIAGQTVQDRPIEIFRVDTIGSGSACDIAYLGGSSSQSIANALRAVRGAAIFTVTDDADTPGMADFTIQGGRVRFRIDQDAARESGLSISSKLLNLALSVKSSGRIVTP